MTVADRFKPLRSANTWSANGPDGLLKPPVQGLRIESLDAMLALRGTHLNHLVRESVAHHNAERPHRSP
jgi:hypothetical protein